MALTQCQQCAEEFSADFGLVTCPNCGNVQLLSEDGSPIGIADIQMPTGELPPIPEDNLVEAPGVFDLGEVEEYANSEISSAAQGQYVYDLFIEGVDTKEVRFLLREALSERRLGLDAEALMSQVKLGRLEIIRLSPIKTSLIVQRIKLLPLQITWKQHAIVEL